MQRSCGGRIREKEKIMTDIEDLQTVEQELAKLPDGAVKDFVSANRETVEEMLAAELVQEQAICRMSRKQE